MSHTYVLVVDDDEKILKFLPLLNGPTMLN